MFCYAMSLSAPNRKWHSISPACTTPAPSQWVTHRALISLVCWTLLTGHRWQNVPVSSNAARPLTTSFLTTRPSIGVSGRRWKCNGGNSRIYPACFLKFFLVANPYWSARLGCFIFCYDIGSCVFKRGQPLLSPAKFAVQMPCFESCWLAQSAADCLRQLQKAPVPLPISAAIKKIRSASAINGQLFDASDFGMLAVVIGDY